MTEDQAKAALTGHIPECNGETEKENELQRKRQSVVLKRARSRVTAQIRRRRERQLFKELADLLPLPNHVGDHLNKAAIIRLTVGYLHVRALLDSTSLQQRETTAGTLDVERPSSLESIHCPSMSAGCVEEGLLDLGLGRFLLVIFFNGQVIFTTENVNKYIGINQMDLIGRSLFDIMHLDDQKEVKQVLTNLAGNAGPQKCSMFWRTRSSQNLRPLSVRVLHCTGVKRPLATLATHCLMLLCRPLPVPAVGSVPAGLSHRSFLSIHSPDMRFTYCDSRIWELTGFQDTELFGQSVYKYYHTSDYLKLIQAHFCLLSKGQVATGRYRFLVKHGGYAWAETEASVMYDSQTRQPQNILCINYLLSDVVQGDVVFSQEQLDHSLRPRGLCSGTAASSPLLIDKAGHNTETQANGLALLYNTSDHNCSPRSSATLNRNACEKTAVSYDMWDGDLDALAPYIAMDEDALLLPRLNYPWKERRESSHACGLSGNILDIHHDYGGKPQHASECVLCSADPMAINHMRQTQPQLNHTSWTQTHRLAQSDQAAKQRTSGDPWLAWSSVRAIVEKEYSTPQTHTPHYPPRYQTVKMTPVQSSSWCTTIPQNRQTPVSQHHPYPIWQRDKDGWVHTGEQDSSFSLSSVRWTGPTHSGHTKDPQHHVKPRPDAKPQGYSGVYAVTLPVLSQRECEVNAPLGPASYLLKGPEITSVLDEAATRISVGW